MLKKILIILFVIIAAVTIGIVVFEKTQGARISSDLSDRSKTFIEQKQRRENTSEFSNLIAERGEDTRGKTMTVGNCFSFLMPYAVFNSREEGECNGYFAFDRPRGSIVAYMENASSANIEDASGVSMRRQTPKQYEEKQIEVGGRKFYGFIDKNSMYTITTYHLTSNKVLILTLKLPAEDDEKLKGILASVKFL